MTERQKWVLEFLRMFEAGELSGDMTVRFRDGVPVECVPAPRYRMPEPGRRAKESRP